MAGYESEFEEAGDWFTDEADEPRVNIPPRVKIAVGITAVGLLGASVAIARQRLQNKDGE